jgi:hypothetical protein
LIFEVTPEQIELLSDADLRTLVGYLAEQEAIRATYSAACVTYGGHQNAKDGGIDVRIETGGNPITGYIPRPLTAFQVKAENMPKSEILKEMRPKGVLRPAIKSIGEAGGAYIIASSKGSVSDTALSARKNAMAEAMADAPNAAGIHLDFYDRRRMASWVNQHPGLIPWVRSHVGQALSGWRPFEDWSSSPGAADEPYLADDSVRLMGAHINERASLDAVNGINHLREILARPKGIARLVGLSGVGKTRLVQALFDPSVGEDALSPRLAIYTDLSDEPDPVPLELLRRLHDLDQRCVLIVDNCGIELHRKLAAQMTTANSLVRLVTIEYDISDDEPENTDVFRLEPASSQLIEKIVERRYPKLTAPEISTIAEFSEGNSRIALVLANTAQEGESLANLNDSELFKRLFQQKNADNPDLLRAAKACSLVYSFDGETLEGDEAELPVVASLTDQTPAVLHGHVAELYRRQLVQRRSRWRAVLPHALAHRLAKSALQDIPKASILNHLTSKAPERLIKSFSRRLGRIHDSLEAQTIVAEWLGENGWIARLEELDKLGITIFDNIAPVIPSAILDSISEAAKRSDKIFDQSNPHRETIVRILRSLAYDPALFDKAVNLLRHFAHTIDASNNTGEAVNVFNSLFSLYLSGTHAPAAQRADFIRELSKSADRRDQALVVSAVDAMLECSHFSSSYGFEFGTRKRDYGLNPRTPREIKDWYNAALALSLELSALPDYRESIRSLIAGQFRQLASQTGMVDELITLADAFAAEGGWPQGWVGVRGAISAARKAKRMQNVKKLTALADRLKPNSLSDRIASYVVPAQWTPLDVADVDFEDEKKYQKAQKHADAMCDQIGEELANDLTALVKHLPAMLGPHTNRSWNVVRMIGRKTPDPVAAWNAILSVTLSPEYDGQLFGFPSAFLSGLSEKNPETANAILDAALKDKRLHPYFVNMQCSVGIDERGCDRLIAASKMTTVPTLTFANLQYGRVCHALPAARFRELLLAISRREEGLDRALEILHMRLYSRRSDKEPIEPDDRQTGRELLTEVAFEKNNQREGHALAIIVRLCLAPPSDNAVAAQLCRRLRDAIVQLKVYAWHYSDLFSSLGTLFPRIVLDEFVERTLPGHEDRRSNFGMFREISPCPLRTIDDAILLDWAKQKPETRFVQLAEVIRPWTSPHPKNQPAPFEDEDPGPMSWTPAARRLIHEAPDPIAVLATFYSNFRPSGWGGSLVDILTGRMPLLEELATDPDPQIADWAKGAINSFKDEIESERKWEAERDRNRDERFEW